MIHRKKGTFFVATVALLAVAFFVRPGEAQKPRGEKPKTAATWAPVKITGPVFMPSVGFAETRPMREFAVADSFDAIAVLGKGKEINELNSDLERTPDPNAPVQYDGALQTTVPKRDAAQPNIPGPALTFEGIGVNGSAPPDSTGAIGPNDYVETVNSQVRVYDRNGVPRGPAFKLSSLFAGFGAPVATSDSGDQIVLYDRMANRWLIGQFAFTSQTTPPYHQAIAISKTGDPMGEYWVYDFISPGVEFPDYFKFGAWPDGYYYTDRQFTNGGAYNGFGCICYDRAKMLVGDSSAGMVYFSISPNVTNASSGMIPTDFNGLTPPPAGAPNVFATHTDNAFGDPADALRLFNFHVDFVTPANSTFTERPESPLAVASFDSRNPANRADIEQPPPAGNNATDRLDSIADRLMLRMQYYNRGGVETYTTCHTVNATPVAGTPTAAQFRAANRHYILQKSNPGDPLTVADQATFSPDTTERWMGSTAVDNAGNMAIGYSISSLTVNPGIAWAGRLVGDPANTLAQGEAVMFPGPGVQRGTSNRWGDYSNMSLDPADDATFWHVNEYLDAANPTAGFSWHTRIGNFKFPGTVAPPQGTLAGTITACGTGAVLKDALVQVSGGPSTGFSSATLPNGTYAMKLSPGNYSVMVSDPAHQCVAIGPFNVTITDGVTTTLNQCLTGTAKYVFQSAAVSVAGGNGNGVIEPNECNNLNVTILNNGCFLGSGVSAVLSTSTPGVTITQPNSPYPNAVESATSLNAIPFQVSTSPAFVCGTTINFSLTVSFAGGTSTFPFSLVSCVVPPTTVNGTLETGDTVQENRLGRDSVASGCGTVKACPGVLAGGVGDRRYDVLTFPNGPGVACATIKTTVGLPASTNPVIPAAYLATYVPPGVGTGTNICLNYLGDAGGSPDLVNSFSVDVPANTTLVVVIQEANAGQPSGSPYSVEVSGLVGSGVGPGPCAPAPSVVSRKMHGATGPFSIPLPLTGTQGIEDRVGNGGVAGTHTVVLSFASDPTGASASIAANNPSGATGMVSGVSYSGNDMIVNLTGVQDKQVLTLSTSGGSVSPAVVPIAFLSGDTNGDRSVDAVDISQTKAQSGNPAVILNFRTDVSVDGTVDAVDISLVKSKSGNGLP